VIQTSGGLPEAADEEEVAPDALRLADHPASGAELSLEHEKGFFSNLANMSVQFPWKK
jgi:hypothetical protein